MSTTGGGAPDRASTNDSGQVSGPAPGTPSAPEIVAHPRTGRLRSIQLRLILPIVVATVGLLVLGAIQTRFALSTSVDARRAQVMAGTATATVRLVYRVGQEVAEADALRARGGTAGGALVSSAQGQTDLAARRFRTAARAAQAAAPALDHVLGVAEQQLARLPSIRQTVQNLKLGQLSGDRYADLSAGLIAVADALPTQLSDAQLAATARAVGAIAAAEHLGAQQRDLLSQAFRRGTLAPGELADLARLTGAQDERLAEFVRSASPTELARYQDMSKNDEVVSATKMRMALLSAQPGPNALKVDPDVWYIAQSNTLRRWHLLELRLSANLDASSRDRQVRAQASSILTSTGTALLVLLAFGAALLFGVRTSRRLRGLGGAALAIAYTELPRAITALSEAQEPGDVRSALHEAVGHADELTVAGVDEIGEMGAALGAVHHQALRLAAEQALLRLDVAGLFVALSRRGQSLIHRQIQLIDEFEHSEADLARRERIFVLDHLAARMRRNEENLLVLAGGEPGQRVTSAVPLDELIQSAAAEIEDYARVDTVAVADIAIAAHAVRDLTHLLAELLENATTYSPPASRVRISARRAVDGVSLTVFDEGIGMQPTLVAELNTRLSRPTTLTAELAGTMGLLVVARLAARYQIQVELRSAPGGGTAVLVSLPTSVLAPMPTRPDGVERRVPARHRPVPPLPPSPPVAAPVTTHRGLPQRRPGGLLLADGARDADLTRDADLAGDADLTGDANDNLPPDPDTVRVRLSGLANGLAAAARRNQDSST
jgi:signal transduction histidine kinase